MPRLAERCGDRGMVMIAQSSYRTVFAISGLQIHGRRQPCAGCDMRLQHDADAIIGFGRREA